MPEHQAASNASAAKNKPSLVSNMARRIGSETIVVIGLSLAQQAQVSRLFKSRAQQSPTIQRSPTPDIFPAMCLLTATAHAAKMVSVQLVLRPALAIATPDAEASILATPRAKASYTLAPAPPMVESSAPPSGEE